MVAITMAVPPMVGVPRLVLCAAGPSSRTCWRSPRRTKIWMISGVPNRLTSRATPADTRIVFTARYLAAGRPGSITAPPYTGAGGPGAAPRGSTARRPGTQIGNRLPGGRPVRDAGGHEEPLGITSGARPRPGAAVLARADAGPAAGLRARGRGPPAAGRVRRAASRAGAVAAPDAAAGRPGRRHRAGQPGGD